MNYKKYIAIKVSSYLNLSIEKIENSIVTPSDIKNGDYSLLCFKLNEKLIPFFSWECRQGVVCGISRTGEHQYLYGCSKKGRKISEASWDKNGADRPAGCGRSAAGPWAVSFCGREV